MCCDHLRPPEPAGWHVSTGAFSISRGGVKRGSVAVPIRLERRTGSVAKMNASPRRAGWFPQLAHHESACLLNARLTVSGAVLSADGTTRVPRATQSP